jgi:hypothetical protein
MEFSGRLVSFPIAELLQWAHTDRRTGALVVRRTSREKRIYFDQGRIAACLTDQPSEYYGQFLLLNGYIDEVTLVASIDQCRGGKIRLGKVLEEQGILSRKEVERTLRQHMEDLILDIFLWRHGVFFFSAEKPPAEEILAEPVDTLGMALEGARWSDELTRIRTVFEHDQVVLDLVPGHVPQVLGARQRRIVRETDGVRALGEVYQRVSGSYFRFLEAVYELHRKRVLRIVDVLQEAGASTVEMSLHDILLEQAATESAQAVRRYFSSPIGVFQRFVPVWTQPPSAEEWKRMPEPVRAFYRKFDGKNRLAEIFSDNEKDWDQETELLMLQVGKESVALLPAPLQDLRERHDESEWVTLFGQKT